MQFSFTFDFIEIDNYCTKPTKFNVLYVICFNPFSFDKNEIVYLIQYFFVIFIAKICGNLLLETGILGSTENV